MVLNVVCCCSGTTNKVHSQEQAVSWAASSGALRSCLLFGDRGLDSWNNAIT